MNTSGEAADQVVRMTLNGVEVAAVNRAAAKQVAVMLYAISKTKKRPKENAAVLYAEKRKGAARIRRAGQGFAKVLRGRQAIRYPLLRFEGQRIRWTA